MDRWRYVLGPDMWSRYWPIWTRPQRRGYPISSRTACRSREPRHLLRNRVRLIQKRRTNYESRIFIDHVERHGPGDGQSLVAVDPVCRRRRTVDVEPEEEPGPGSLLVVAGRVGEISDSVFHLGESRQPLCMVP